MGNFMEELDWKRTELLAQSVAYTLDRPVVEGESCGLVDKLVALADLGRTPLNVEEIGLMLNIEPQDVRDLFLNDRLPYARSGNAGEFLAELADVEAYAHITSKECLSSFMEAFLGIILSIPANRAYSHLPDFDLAVGHK